MNKMNSMKCHVITVQPKDHLETTKTTEFIFKFWFAYFDRKMLCNLQYK